MTDARRFLSLRAALTQPRIGTKESAFFWKRLSFLLSSGMPLAAALELSANQDAGSSGRLYRALAADVSAGRPLANAIHDTGAWSPFAVAVIEAGEASGRLPESLGYLADETAKSAALRGKVLGALAYPTVIAFVATALVVALTAFIFPKVIPLLSSLGVTLPWPTRVVMTLSAFVRTYGLLTLVLLSAGAASGVVFVRRNRKIRWRLHSTLLLVPVVGPMLREWSLASSARMLGTLLESGMPAHEAAAACARACGNLAYKDAYEALGTAVERGAPISATLATEGRLFPPIATGMIAVGEASGTLPEAFHALAAFYESETDARTRTLSSLVEPAVMIAMGLAIGFVAVSIIAPIYALTGRLHA